MEDRSYRTLGYELTLCSPRETRPTIAMLEGVGEVRCPLARLEHRQSSRPGSCPVSSASSSSSPCSSAVAETDPLEPGW